MIEAKETLIGHISAKQSLAGKLNNAIQYIQPTTQEKTITPTKEEQVVIPDDNIFALSKVTIEKIPDEYIIPNGDIEINSNGTYDVTEKANAIVNVPEKQLGTKTITTNGTYNASDDNLDGYSSVEVETSGIDVNEYFETTITSSNQNNFMRNNYLKSYPIKTITISSNVTSLQNTFSGLKEMINIEGETKQIKSLNNTFANAYFSPYFDTSGVTNFSYSFYGYYGTEIAQYDTSNGTAFDYMLQYSSDIETIPLLDFQKALSLGGMLANCSKLENLGGFKDLGKAYLTTRSANYSNYTLGLSGSNNLTHDSLMNVINNLYDIASKGCNTQKLQLGSTNLAKLTEEEIAIAQNKGWTVS